MEQIALYTWSEKFEIDVRHNAIFELFIRFDEIVFTPHCGLGIFYIFLLG